MNNEPNIDEWLKENFEQFSPNAPDVWQGISKGIQSAQAAQSGAGLTAAAKGSAMIVKVITAAVAVAGLTAGYVLYTQSEQQPELATQTKTEQTVQADQPTEQQVSTQETANIAAEKSVSQQSESHVDKTNNAHVVSTQPQVVERTKSASQNQSGEATNPTTDKQTVVAQSIEQPVAAVITPQPKPEQNQVNVAKVEAPKQIAETTDTPQPEPAKRPYNPNEGETGFDKSNIPNAFSPDNDGLNDRFVIDISGETFYHVMVTDLKGRVVFESFDKTNTWDGKDQKTGVLCPAGNYRWIFQYKFKEADKQHTINGLLKLFN